MKKISTNQTNQMMIGITRNEKKKQGFFDGRYRTRKITNKKKEQELILSRKNRINKNTIC
jgi:hypothetical protein